MKPEKSTIDTYLWLYPAGLSIILRIILLLDFRSNSRPGIAGFIHETPQDYRSTYLNQMLDPPAHIGK